MKPEAPPQPELPKAVPPPPIPGQTPGQKPGAKPQTNVSWLNTKTGQTAGAPSVPQAGKQLTGQ